MKRDYLARLSRAARWYLPPAEAAEVLEDYRDIAGDRTDEELERDLGKPWRVARQLAQPKAYRRWLAVFLALVLCGGLPAAMVLDHDYWNTVADVVEGIGLCLGVVLSALWFRRNGSREGMRSKEVLPLLVLLVIGMAWVWVIAGAALTGSWIVPIMEIEQVQHLSLVEIARMMHVSLVGGALAMGILAAFALVKARLGDRRWLAAYVLGLAGALLAVSVWSLLTSMSLDFNTPGWQTPYLVRYIFITLVGLVGTAVSLC